MRSETGRRTNLGSRGSRSQRGHSRITGFTDPASRRRDLSGAGRSGPAPKTAPGQPITRRRPPCRSGSALFIPYHPFSERIGAKKTKKSLSFAAGFSSRLIGRPRGRPGRPIAHPPPWCPPPKPLVDTIRRKAATQLLPGAARVGADRSEATISANSAPRPAFSRPAGRHQARPRQSGHQHAPARLVRT